MEPRDRLVIIPIGGSSLGTMKMEDVMTEEFDHTDGLTCKNGHDTAWDDVTNAPLNPILMRKAREVEMVDVHRLGVLASTEISPSGDWREDNWRASGQRQQG